MNNFNWLEEVDLNQHLDSNSQLIVEECGTDVYLKLVNLFAKTQVYFSMEPITKAKQDFILRNRDKLNARDLARILCVSESFVYRVLRDG